MMRRRIFQILGTIIPNSYFGAFTGKLIYQGNLKSFCVPSLNCYACPLALFSCPIGTLQHFIMIRQIPFYTIGILGVTGAVVGRMVCGWICPFGFLQDILYRIRSFKIKIPSKLSYLKYVSLIFVVGVIVFFTQESWFCKLCPQGALQAGIPLVIASEEIRNLIGGFFVLKLSILAGFLFLFVISKRPFCRLFCPLGAIYSLFNRISLVRLKFDENLCTRCNECVTSCPADIVPYTSLNSSDCIMCWGCMRICPEKAISSEFEF